MKKFNKLDLVAFIRALDRNLDSSAEILVVGGAAAIVGYGSDIYTSDIDVFDVRKGSSESIMRAAMDAQRETHLTVSVSGASVAEMPYDYEDRLREVKALEGLSNLTILIPDKYDLALSKMIRGYVHDIDAIEGINEHHRLAMKTLVDRFEKEVMNEITSDPRKVCLNVAMLVSRLYGYDEGKKLAERWGVPVPMQRTPRG